MADDYRELTTLIECLAQDGKYLTIKVSDTAPETHLKAGLAPDPGPEPRPCKKWGYDPMTNQTICLER